MNLWSEGYSSFLLVSLRVESLVPRGGQRTITWATAMWCMEPVPLVFSKTLVLSFLFLFRFSASGIFLSLQVKISQPVFQRKFLLIQRRSNGRTFWVTGFCECTRFSRNDAKASMPSFVPRMSGKYMSLETCVVPHDIHYNGGTLG